MPPKSKPTGDLKEAESDVELSTPTPAAGVTPYSPVETTMALPEIPVVYLLDRSNWVDFKRALNECAMTWNFPGWMTTIVYHGKEWREMSSKGVDLAQYFPTTNKKNAGDGVLTNISALSDKLVGLLDLPKNLTEYRDSSLQFCNLTTVEFEPDRKLPARQKFWSWLVRGLRGSKSVPGQYYYLVDEVQRYDIQYLFKRLCQVLEQVTICSLDDELEAVIKLDYKPQTHTIFTYYAELRKAVKRLHDVNDRLPESARIVLPDSYLRSRLVRAARQVAVFKPVVDTLLMKRPEEWGKITVEELYHQLEQVAANDQSASARQHRYTAPTNDDGVTANTVNVAQGKKNEKKSSSLCHSFSRTGECKRENCPYAHKQEKQEARNEQKQEKSRPPLTCWKCGEGHNVRDCKFKGKCGWCKKDGHKENVCNSKKAGKPQVLAALVPHDGVPIKANVTIVNDATLAASSSLAAAASLCYNSVVSDGRVRETFFADTGANRTLHPNTKSAASFYRVGLDIGTAHGGKSMKSEGVGKMLLYNASGAPMPGFDRVVFAPQAAEKLCSVGDLCDAGMVCVFTHEGLKTYMANEVKIDGKEFTHDARDKRTRLYPLSLYRKVGEKDVSHQISAIAHLSVTDASIPASSISDKLDYKCEWENLPEIIEAGDELPAALLAKTYVKNDLSQIDRYHAKFGDVGIKYMKRAMPSLKIPSQYRCEHCIDGKIHKFGHRACAPGTRTEYSPGVCIHSDHSGPYAKSIGGARYSQLYLDRGSGYLWAARMKKKTGHYDETPKVLLDSAALSGRRVQIFHTDGDGVFSSKETASMMAEEKIRHEYSAPYDSNTNPFVERARRTIFEGVCTALLRAGAPASFWGEAECHKIFTMNVLPTEKDPTDEKKFVSRKNLLEGNRRPFNLERLMAFGTAVTCYIPKEKRKGGKEPAQRRSFRGVLMGYAENMPAYRVWDISARKLTQVSFNFTICHEGFYPFRDRANWAPEMFSDPQNFSPIVDGVLTTYEWKKFDFDDEDAEEVLGLVPALLVDQPEPPPPVLPKPDHADPPSMPLLPEQLGDDHVDRGGVPPPYLKSTPKFLERCFGLSKWPQ